jgi:hypothetical protein
MSALHTCANPLYPIISAPPPATSCQRWRERVAKERPAGEVFRSSDAEAVAIDEATAKAFVTRHHYSASYPAARFRVGMMWRPSSGRECLAGVVVFSVPMNERTVPRYFADLAPAAGVELGRLVLLDEVPANAESWLVARAFKLLRAALPSIAGVVSYSDPLERVATDGTIVKPGHVGTVYQALNAAYRGRSSSRTLLIAGDGRAVSHGRSPSCAPTIAAPRTRMHSSAAWARRSAGPSRAAAPTWRARSSRAVFEASGTPAITFTPGAWTAGAAIARIPAPTRKKTP